MEKILIDEFNKSMQQDDANNFGYIVDKSTNKLIALNQSQINNILTPQKSNITDLEDIIEQDKVIINCANTLMDKNSFDISIQKLLQIICEFYGGNYACLFERNYETLLSNVNYKYHHKDVNLIDPKFTASFKFTNDDVWTTFLKQSNYAFLQTDNDIDEVLLNSSYYKRFMESKRKNLLVVSLNDNGTILGAIEIDNVTKNTDKIDLIRTICAFIVNNLHIKYVNEDLHENVKDLRIKNDINNTILECVSTLVYDESIRHSIIKLLDVITNYFCAGSTSIFFNNYRKEKTSFSHVVYSNNVLEEFDLPVSPINELIALFDKFQSNGVGFIPSATDFAEILEKDFPIMNSSMKDSNVETVLFSPLYHNNKIVGFIGVENATKNFDEVQLVKTISNFVINLIIKDEMILKLEKLSYMDNLTNVYNRNFYNNFIQEFKASPRNRLGVVFADINSLKKANDSYGHDLGDRLIIWSAKFLKTNLNGLIFRIGGDEFICIIENVIETTFNNIVENLNDKINNLSEKHMSIGSVWADNFPDIEALVAKADENMYYEKQQYYKELMVDTRTVKESLEDLKKSIENLSN